MDPLLKEELERLRAENAQLKAIVFILHGSSLILNVFQLLSMIVHTFLNIFKGFQWIFSCVRNCLERWVVHAGILAATRTCRRDFWKDLYTSRGFWRRHVLVARISGGAHLGCWDFGRDAYTWSGFWQ